MPRSSNPSPNTASGTVPSGLGELVYHFCCLQLPMLQSSPDMTAQHLQRTYLLFNAKRQTRDEPPLTWSEYLQSLYPLDWYLCAACLESNPRAWELLFASRTGRSDCLLVDALRSRAVRLYPGNEEAQESAVSEFWSQLLVSDNDTPPVLARFDGQRPLVPWLIRVFQNQHLSHLRPRGDLVALPEDDLALPLPNPAGSETRWHELFCLAARDWLSTLNEDELLLLGLRWRYRMNQRKVAEVFGLHEGNISKRITQLQERCHVELTRQLEAQHWTGENLSEYIRTEMPALLMDDPRLAADQLAQILQKRGKGVPNLPN